jgi:hypothetical protein
VDSGPKSATGEAHAVQSPVPNQRLAHPLQAKLIVNTPGDHYEQEADRVADQVMLMPDAGPVDLDASTATHVTLQRASSGDFGHAEAPPIVHEVLRSSGQPLDEATRAYFEPRFGVSLSDVRVHTDKSAEQSAGQLGANAYTVGHDVVFGEGRFAPSASEGRRLIAHELAHVVQQNAGLAGTLQRQPSPDLEPYQIEGGEYPPKMKQYAAEDPAGLIRTSSIIGKQEQKLTAAAPLPISVSKEMTRFEGGSLGTFVIDWNDFTQYMYEVLHNIGRLRDLLSAGAPEAPTDMTAAQKRALRPTDDTTATAGIKVAYRDWRKSQARYATAAGGSPRGLVFEVAEKHRAAEFARQAFWEAKGALSRTIAAAKRLAKPGFDLDLKFADLLSLADPYAFIAMGVDKLLEARKARETYDKKMQEFQNAIKDADQTIQDDFEAFKNATNAYWEKETQYLTANDELEQARIQSREDAALVGQWTADRSGARGRGKDLGEVRMPELVADAWHALATIGPAARKKLLKVLGGRAVVERASTIYDKWRNDPLALEDITQIRLAWQRAQSWEPVLTKEDVEEWIAMNNLWEETLGKFDV